MKLTADDALALSKALRDISVALGDYRFDHWDDLTPAQRRLIEDEEWALLADASDVNTKAVGLVLDEAQAGLDALQKSTKTALKAVQTLKDVKRVINVAAAAVGLAAAVLAKDPGAIAKNVKALVDAATAKSS